MLISAGKPGKRFIKLLRLRCRLGWKSELPAAEAAAAAANETKVVKMRLKWPEVGCLIDESSGNLAALDRAAGYVYKAAQGTCRRR